MAFERRAPVTLPFAVDRWFGLASLPFGVTPGRARVEVDDERLVARFGPWVVDTPLANVASAEVTGPYTWFKVAGPAHLSLKDRGLTFATTNRQGACLTFHEPVAGLDPWGRILHPGLTVTVAEPQRLVDLLSSAAGRTNG